MNSKITNTFFYNYSLVIFLNYLVLNLKKYNELKTSFTSVISIYTAIGLKKSTVAILYKTLKNKLNSYYKLLIIASMSSDTAALQFTAPYSGCTFGEYFRDLGLSTLLIYDDLSKHAVAYRQISLLLRRPPGREAYPGDIYFLFI